MAEVCESASGDSGERGGDSLLASGGSDHRGIGDHTPSRDSKMTAKYKLFVKKGKRIRENELEERCANTDCSKQSKSSIRSISSSASAKKAEAAANAAVLRVKLTGLDEEINIKAKLEKLQLKNQLEAENAKIETIQS